MKIFIKNRKIKIAVVISIAFIFSNPTNTKAASPGGFGFGILNSTINYFTSIGGHSVASNAFVAGQTFYAGAGNGMMQPQGIALDSTNNFLYVADVQNNRVVKLTKAGAFVGAIGNIASSSGGTCPDSGAATGWCTGGVFALGGADGMFKSPYAVALDLANDFLFIVEASGHRITKVKASTGAFIGSIGKTTATTGTCPASGATGAWCTGGTFASGTGDGMFNAPRGITYDSIHDALYIPEQGGHKISKITASTGAFVGAIGKTTSSAGSCPATGAAPGWCTGGVFSSGAGNGMYSKPYSTTIDFTNNILFIADGLNARVVKVVLTTGAFVGAVGKTTASSGTCPATGIASTWCTGGTFANGVTDGSYTVPFGIVYDSANDLLYLTDLSGHNIVKITASTGTYIGAVGNTSATIGTCPVSGAAPGWCTGGGFQSGADDGMYSNLSGIILDSANSVLYVCDAGNYRIAKVTVGTGAFQGAVGGVVSADATWGMTNSSPAPGKKDGMFNRPIGSAYDATNKILYVVDSGNNRIVKVAATTGTVVGSIGNLSGSTGTCPASGAASGWCSGGKFIAGATDGMFSNPIKIAIDPVNDFLFITDSSNSRIVKVTASTGAFVGAIGWVLSSSGTCPASGAATTWCTGGTFTGHGNYDGVSAVTGVAYDSTNNAIYVSDPSNNKIVKLTATTGAFVGAIGGTTASTGTCPASGVAPGWCTNGTFTAGSSNGTFSNLNGLAYDSVNDALYIGDGARLVKVTATTGAFVGAIGKVTSSTGTCPATGVASGWCTGGIFATGLGDGGFYDKIDPFVDPSSNTLFIADKSNNRISKHVTTTGAFVGAIGKTNSSSGNCPSTAAANSWCTGGAFGSGGKAGMLYNPDSVVYDPSGKNLFIMDTVNNRIQKMSAK